MDDASHRTTPMRDPRYAPRNLEVRRGDDGTLTFFNPTSLAGAWATTTAALAHWGALKPTQTWLAERSGEGWREIT